MTKIVPELQQYKTSYGAGRDGTGAAWSLLVPLPTHAILLDAWKYRNIVLGRKTQIVIVIVMKPTTIIYRVVYKPKHNTTHKKAGFETFEKNCEKTCS